MKKNLEYKQTETISITARWKDSTGTPFELNKASFQIRDTYGQDLSNPSLFSLDETDGIELDDFGWAKVLGTVGDTVPAGTYKYDLLVQRASDSSKKVLLEGDILIKEGVSVIL